MSKITIKARVYGQSIQLANLPLIASGSEGVHQIECEFDDLWTGYGKTAVFYIDESEVYHVPLMQGIATVPSEVLTDGGFFFFGIFGSGENTPTTEVLRVNVVKGAITTATASPADPTPNIYRQIMQAYEVMGSRLSELVAMRGVGGISTSVLSDEYINGTITSNGSSAYINFQITDLSLVAGGYHFSDYCIPPELAPLCPVNGLTSNPDLNVSIFPADAEHDGWARLIIENPSTEMYTTDMVTMCTGIYPLAAPSNSELGDIRVGYDGTRYATAGEAVRQQIAALFAKSVAVSKLAEVTLRASAWTGKDNLHSQIVTVEGATPYSKVDLLPSPEQLAIFHNKDVAFVTENEDGVVTVFAIGDKPTQDYTMQAQITEVEV